MPFGFTRLEIPDVILITPAIFEDERGAFMETYRAGEFEAHGIDLPFVQDNHSISKKGVIRGLHYQLLPSAQGKLIRCVRGKIWDVAVDIRRGSPWYGKWVGCELSSENRRMLWIPPGFAHGFAALEDSEVLYKCSSEYNKECERGILWNDPQIGIDWMIKDPILSEKDASWPRFTDADNNFEYVPTAKLGGF